MGNASPRGAARVIVAIVGLGWVIHPDTSFLIRALVPGSTEDGRLREWIEAGEHLAMSTIAWAEFLCGPVEPTHVELAAQVLPERSPFSDDDARLAARLFNEAGRRRGSLLDCMIAATAIRADAAVATTNVSDFQRLEDLGLVLAAS